MSATIDLLAAATTNAAELGGTADTLDRLAAGRSHPARVHHGRPVTMGPAVCQGCGSRVWWSGGLWADASGTWHRCAR